MFFSNQPYHTLSEKPPAIPTSPVVVIRMATIFDIQQILIMAKKLRKMSVATSHEIPDSENKMSMYRGMITTIINGKGLALIAENCNGLLGYIAGRLEYNVWVDNSIMMYEAGFYASTKRAGVMLLKEYISRCNKLKEMGKIQFFIIGEMPGISPDYSKFGMKPTDTLWMA